VSNITTPVVHEPKAPKLELLDCGQASKVTKGFPLYLLFEISLPPFDRQLLIW
jgi:hypothetical protein